MKTRIVATSLCFFTLGVLFAKNAGWKDTQKPNPSLPEAYQIALDSLKERKIDYFCISASVARTFSACDWEFSFSSKEGKQVWVSVNDKSEAKVSDTGFNY